MVQRISNIIKGYHNRVREMSFHSIPCQRRINRLVLLQSPPPPPHPATAHGPAPRDLQLFIPVRRRHIATQVCARRHPSLRYCRHVIHLASEHLRYQGAETGIGGVGNKKVTSKRDHRYQRLAGEACISCR